MRDLNQLEIKDIFPSFVRLGEVLESLSLDYEVVGTYDETTEIYDISVNVRGDDKELLQHLYNTLEVAYEKMTDKNESSRRLSQ